MGGGGGGLLQLNVNKVGTNYMPKTLNSEKVHMDTSDTANNAKT